MSEHKDSSEYINHSVPLDGSDPPARNTYQQAQAEVSTRQLELQHELHNRIQQLKALRYFIVAHNPKDTNCKLFLQLIATLMKQHMQLARKNREVASVGEIEDNRRALKKLIWFGDISEFMTDPRVVDQVSGEGLLGDAWKYGKEKIWPKIKAWFEGMSGAKYQPLHQDTEMKPTAVQMQPIPTPPLAPVKNIAEVRKPEPRKHPDSPGALRKRRKLPPLTIQTQPAEESALPPPPPVWPPPSLKPPPVPAWNGPPKPPPLPEWKPASPPPLPPFPSQAPSNSDSSSRFQFVAPPVPPPAFTHANLKSRLTNAIDDYLSQQPDEEPAPTPVPPAPPGPISSYQPSDSRTDLLSAIRNYKRADNQQSAARADLTGDYKVSEPTVLQNRVAQYMKSRRTQIQADEDDQSGWGLRLRQRMREHRRRMH